MHKWLGLILYAMVSKIQISPMKAMVKQWLSNFRMTGPIDCTSLVNRIASSMGILDGNDIHFKHQEDECDANFLSHAEFGAFADDTTMDEAEEEVWDDDPTNYLGKVLCRKTVAYSK